MRGKRVNLQKLPYFLRLLAGGCPAASDFLLFGQEKSHQREGHPLRWPSASRSRQAQAGQCGNSLRHNFKGSEAQTSALLLTGLSLPSAAAQRGEKQSRPGPFDSQRCHREAEGRGDPVNLAWHPRLELPQPAATSRATRKFASSCLGRKGDSKIRFPTSSYSLLGLTSI